jgi:hypothetical protein
MGRLRLRAPHSVASALKDVEEIQTDDDHEGHTEQPQDNSTHDSLLMTRANKSPRVGGSCSMSGGLTKGGAGDGQSSLINKTPLLDLSSGASPRSWTSLICSAAKRGTSPNVEAERQHPRLLGDNVVYNATAFNSPEGRTQGAPRHCFVDRQRRLNHWKNWLPGPKCPPRADSST